MTGRHRPESRRPTPDTPAPGWRQTSLRRDLVDSALLVPRLLGSVSRVLPDVVEQLPGTVRDVRQLVGGLARVVEPGGALTQALESAASPQAWREGRPVRRTVSGRDGSTRGAPAVGCCGCCQGTCTGRLSAR